MQEIEAIPVSKLSIGHAIRAFALAAIAATLCPHIAHAQVAAAGVEVDSSGVLRTRMLNDTTGTLSKQWQAQAKARLGADLATASPLRKVSLTRLERVIAQRAANNQGIAEEMKFLAGLTRLQYVFFYPETGDIVLAGPAEGFAPDAAGRMLGIQSGRAVLELQDVVTALRAYPPAGKQTQIIAVSIDPTKEGLQKMQQFLVNISGRVQPGDANNIVAGLKENLGLQNVTVRGISSKTHFAQVMVEADYRMKLIGIGIEQPPVKIVSYVDRASPRDVSRNALQRWYFTPNYECVRVTEDKMAMELVGQGVKLIGENEMVNGDGSRAVAGGTVNRASEAFCTTFTQNYPQLAAKSAVYAQLKNLIDISIAAAYIQQQDFYGQCNWKMDFFGNEESFPVETYETPKQVETACIAIWKGKTLMTPVGGGVHIEPADALIEENLLADEQGEVKALREKTTLDQLKADEWWWD